MDILPNYTIPTFAPNLDTFSDFRKYIERLERNYSHFGIIKVSRGSRELLWMI